MIEASQTTATPFRLRLHRNLFRHHRVSNSCHQCCDTHPLFPGLCFSSSRKQSQSSWRLPEYDISNVNPSSSSGVVQTGSSYQQYMVENLVYGVPVMQ
ncbi:hypothetical protein Hanom_Chr03g00205881 [Helianthus anomalus]